MTGELAARWRERQVRGVRRESSVYLSLHLAGDDDESARPGQFYLLGLGAEAPFMPDPLLLRPMSVLSAAEGSLSFLFKIAGRGTRALADLREGDPLRLLGPLGHSFSTCAEPPPLLVGGGAGIPPLHFHSRRLAAEGMEHRVLFGFNTADEIPRRLLEELETEVELCTLDGTAGFTGNPLDYLERESRRLPARIQACGPPGLLDALLAARRREDRLELSLEERMACGVGACRGCVVPVKAGDDWRYASVCREGPVFAHEELFMGRLEASSDLAPDPGAAAAAREKGEGDD